jgi:hypothetical protein
MFEPGDGSSFNAMQMHEPSAVNTNDGHWRACVSLACPSGFLAPSRKRCEFPQLFSSREAALAYAEQQCQRHAAHRQMVA